MYLRVERRYSQKASEFEVTLRQTVDPEELRRWAFDFMNDHSVALGEVVSNAPASLNRLSQHPPHVFIREREPGGQPCVVLSWLRTDPRIVIGATNFLMTTNSKATKWRDGIYVIKPKKQ